MKKNNPVQRFATIMSWLTLIGAVALPIMAALSWIYTDTFTALTSHNTTVPHDTSNISIPTRFYAFMVSIVGASIQVYGLLALRKTFIEAENARWLSLKAVINFRRFAWVSVIMVFYGILQNSALSVIISMGNPEQQNQISIGVGSNELKAFFTALLFVFAAHIFTAGRQADEENQSFL